MRVDIIAEGRESKQLVVDEEDLIQDQNDSRAIN